MNKEDFLNTVMELVPEYLVHYNVEKISIKSVEKNNGVMLDGLMILVEGENIAPNIYMEHYYDMYKSGYSINDVMNRLVNEYENVRRKMFETHTDSFDIDAMQHNLYLVLVNYEKNKDRLSSCPYIPFLDLAIMFRYVVSDENDCISSGLVRNIEKELWGLSTEELYIRAAENTKNNFPRMLVKMTDKIKQMKPDCGYIPENNMHVLSNKIYTNGAVYMTDKDFLDEFAHSIDSSFYIIPSSVHEVILLPEDEAIEKEALNEIISDVNRYELSELEYLSDHVYYYDMNKKTVTM